MRSILDSRRPHEDDFDMKDDDRPLTKDDILPPPQRPEKKPKYRVLTLEETQELIARGNEPVKETPRLFADSGYTTYSREQVEQWVREHYETKDLYDGLSRRRQNPGEEREDQ